MKRNFKVLELGKSYRAVNGWGAEVVEIDEEDRIYPMKVEFTNGMTNWFTKEGYYWSYESHHKYNLIECLDNPTEITEPTEATELTEQQAIEFLKSKNYTVFKNV